MTKVYENYSCKIHLVWKYNIYLVKNIRQNVNIRLFFQPPKPSDLATICYTSGTTGNPKGVMLTHENIVASMCAVILQFGDHKLKSTDTMISFLPLAHMLERCCEVRIFLLYTLLRLGISSLWSKIFFIHWNVSVF